MSIVKKAYDSYEETWMHILRVRRYLAYFMTVITSRWLHHDESKLVSPEKEVFDIVTPKLKKLKYGSKAYEKNLGEMQDTLKHHYAHNRHHPEHFEDGIKGMTLIDLLEMICDWHAATKRHNDGDIYKSIELNQARFGYSDDIKSILINTARELDLLDTDKK